MRVVFTVPRGFQRGAYGSPKLRCREPKCRCARSHVARREAEQIALTDAQIESFIAAQRKMAPIISKAPQGDQPDPKIMEQLEAVATKYKFANYAEFDDVAENIGLVMSGIDPDTKKYVGPDYVIKKEIADRQRKVGAERQEGTTQRVTVGTEIGREP